MKAETWNQVKDLLNKVLEIEPGGRGDFLRKSDASPEIIAEVESLLACENAATGIMDAPAIAFAQSFLDDEEKDNPLIGQNIGVYKIVSELGYGGMGAVYLAERSDGKFEQRVALKLLKRELNTASLRQRFEQERQILASLEHPNIARLLDVGATEDGIPYFAMEYIEGLPIDLYCQQNNLRLNERLDLFREVCSAVNFAHRNLIVHRDLKPSNILINQDRIPKLLDFGISKIISDEFQQTATTTKFGAMTPSYASPEQLQNKGTSTATDIYSLGVVLYELLSGHRPFEPQEHDLKQIYRAVIESDPPAPSSRTGAYSAARQFRSAVDGEPANDKTTDDRPVDTNPETTSISAQYLRGDLDNIVLKALRKEPERRYSSAENFAEDIHRHQQGLTVTARPNTFSYRATKFVNRNKPVVISAVLLAFVVIIGIVGTVWQARIAQIERDRAQLEATKAKKINEYMKNVLNFSNPHWLSSNPTRASKATISEAMDEALKNIDTDLAGEPGIQAEILFTISQTYTFRGQYDKAETLLRQAIDKFGQVPGDIDPKSMQATVVLADTLYFKGKYEESQKLYLQAIDYFRPQVEKDKSQTIWMVAALTDLGNVYTSEGKFEEAKRVTEEGLEYTASLTSKDRYIIPIAILNYGVAFYNTGDFKTALIYYDKSYEELRKNGNEQSYEAGQLFTNISRAYVWMEEYELADKNLRQAYDILKSTVGEKDFYILSVSYLMAQNLYNQGRYSEAQAEVEKVLAIQHELYPNGHVSIGAPTRLLGDIYTMNHKLKDGEEKIRTSLEIYFKSLKEPNQHISQAKTSLGQNLIAQKRFVEAKEVLTSALDGNVKTRGENHPFTKHCREVLSKIQS